jgi:hypothetical protein
MAKRLEDILALQGVTQGTTRWSPATRQQIGQRSLTEPARLRSSTLANETGPVKNRCVRHAWSIGERELKGVPDRWRHHRVVG